MSERIEAQSVVEEACQELGISLADLIALTSFWVRPEVVAAAAGPRHPNRRRANLGLRVNGVQIEQVGQVIDGIKLDDNTYANTAFKQALGVHRLDFVGFHVCHVWPGTAYDPQCFTHLANLVGIPAPLASLTDHDRHVEACLKYRSWDLYGWTPPGQGPPPRPSNYPERWRAPLAHAGSTMASSASTSPNYQSPLLETLVPVVAPVEEAPKVPMTVASPMNFPPPGRSQPDTRLDLRPPTNAEEQALWAAFYLSKFDHERLGLGNQGETFDRIATRLGVKRTTFKHRRDAFDAHTGSRREGWKAPLGPDLLRVFTKLKAVEERDLRQAVLGFLAAANR